MIMVPCDKPGSGNQLSLKPTNLRAAELLWGSLGVEGSELKGLRVYRV